MSGGGDGLQMWQLAAFIHTFIPLACVVPLLFHLPQNQYIKPNEKFRTYDAEDIFELLNYHD
jgi:hypothetical protein